MSTLGSPRRRPALVLLVAALLLALLGASVSSASALSLNTAKRQFASSQGRCTSQAVAVTTAATSGSAASVSVSNLDPAGCAGKALVVVVYDAAASTWTSAKKFEVSGTVSTAAATLSSATASFTPTAAQRAYVTVGGWPVPATWSYTPASTGPVQPGVPGVVLTGLTWDLITNNPMQTCFTVTAGTSSTVPIPWKIQVDITQPPFNGATNGYSIQSPGGHYALTSNSPSAGFFEVGPDSGRNGDGYRTVVGGPNPVTMNVKICNYSLPAGVQTPSAYTVDVVQSTWTATQACYAVTVRGNGTSQFYFGWQFDLDMSAAYSNIAHFTNWSNPSGNLSQLTWTTVATNNFHAVSKSVANIAGTQQYVFTYCANGY